MSGNKNKTNIEKLKRGVEKENQTLSREIKGEHKRLSMEFNEEKNS